MSVAIFKTVYRKEHRYGYQDQLVSIDDVPYTVCKCGWEATGHDETLGHKHKTLSIIQHRLDHLEGKI